MSSYKIILEGPEARKALALGSHKLATPVISTLGPKSKNVAINQLYPGPKIIHDGVSIAREIYLKDPFENMGAQLVKEAALKTNDLVGDGTTTATLLTDTLIQEGQKLVDGGQIDGVITAKVDSMFLQKELLKYSNIIVGELEKMAVAITDKKDYQRIATVSSASEEIGKIVADAIEKVGPDGSIMVEEVGAFETSLELKEGMEFDNGYLSQYFVTDSDRMIAEYEGGKDGGYVLLTDYTIADPMLLVPIIQKVMEDNNRPLLIVADDVVGPALQALVMTKLDARAGAKLIAVVAPDFGERRKESLEDMAVLLGATVISRDLGKSLKDVELSDLGKFDKVRVTAESTTITPKYPDSEEIDERVNAIKKQIKDEPDGFKKEKLKVRLGRLSQSIAIINVGGASEAEIKDKRERVIDAVHATKAALAEGIIPGGGVALRNIANKLQIKLDSINELVVSALYAPALTILSNAGYAKPEDVLSWREGQGIDVMTGNCVNMLDEGIIDPVKVTKLAVLHSFSIAGAVLTTEALISDDPEEDRSVQKVRAV